MLEVTVIVAMGDTDGDVYVRATRSETVLPPVTPDSATGQAEIAVHAMRRLADDAQAEAIQQAGQWHLLVGAVEAGS